MNNKYIIKCPKCGYEYLPAEIFFPQSFIGKPSDIIRDDDGSIEFFSGDSMNTHEEFECENCNTLFTIDTVLTFTCSYNKSVDFDTEYETAIYKNRIKLEEPK